MASLTRFGKFQPGELDHIKIVSGATHKDQVLECGRCGGQYDPRRGGGRRRFAKMHWKARHTKCSPEEI